MRKVFGIAVLLATVAVLLVAVAPALADSQLDKIECTVQPVIGGPNNAQTLTTPATVTIPDSNPAIRWNPAAIVPGSVFVPSNPD